MIIPKPRRSKMPKKLEDHLDHELRTNPQYKNLSQEQKDKIKYGVMRKTGWKPAREKGEADDIYEATNIGDTPRDGEEDRNYKTLLGWAMSTWLK